MYNFVALLLMLFLNNHIIKTLLFYRPFLLIAVSFVAAGKAEAQIQADHTTEQATTLFSFDSATLRTNLLADFVGAANVGLEVPIDPDNRFTAAADVSYGYARLGNYTVQGFQATLEGRYWIDWWRTKQGGWNVGIYATYCSRFDLQLGGGYQGDGFFSVGASAGYSVSLSNRLSLDFSLMAGYQYLPELRKYGKPENCRLMWEETRYNVSRFTLTGIRMNLVWLINNPAE